mgnify:CR=1 FL=1
MHCFYIIIIIPFRQNLSFLKRQGRFRPTSIKINRDTVRNKGLIRRMANGKALDGRYLSQVSIIIQYLIRRKVTFVVRRSRKIAINNGRNPR